MRYSVYLNDIKSALDKQYEIIQAMFSLFPKAMFSLVNSSRDYLEHFYVHNVSFYEFISKCNCVEFSYNKLANNLQETDTIAFVSLYHTRYFKFHKQAKKITLEWIGNPHRILVKEWKNVFDILKVLINNRDLYAINNIFNNCRGY